MSRKISVKQQKFIDVYIELGNATEAAKRAGYKCRSAHAMRIFVKGRITGATVPSLPNGG